MRFPFLRQLATLGVFSLSIAAMASEIDSFTRRFEPLEDSSSIINKKSNQLLAEALSRANQSKTCKEQMLYSEIRKEFNIILSNGRLVNFIVSDPSVPKHNIARSESIYKYHKITDGYLLARPAADKDGIGMGMTLNFGGHYIGSDKFEHMFGQGFLYFEEYYRYNYSLYKVLTHGIANERTYLGGNPIATGVYTYADLVANFNGMRFWNHILQKNEDILGENLGPYVVCENNEWVQIKDLDFAKYISVGFDEAYNCSSIVTKNGTKGVLRSLDELNKKHNTNAYKCPLEQDPILKDRARFAEVPVQAGEKATVADFLFSPRMRIDEYQIFWTPGVMESSTENTYLGQ